MNYRTPLQVREHWFFPRLELVDADGVVVASAPFRPWHGVPISEDPDYVRQNLEKLATLANVEQVKSP